MTQVVGVGSPLDGGSVVPLAPAWGPRVCIHGGSGDSGTRPLLPGHALPVVDPVCLPREEPPNVRNRDTGVCDARTTVWGFGRPESDSGTLRSLLRPSPLLTGTSDDSLSSFPFPTSFESLYRKQPTNTQRPTSNSVRTK